MGTVVKNLVFVLVLGCVSAGFLLGIKAYTQPIIDKYHEETVLRGAILDAAGVSYTKKTMAEAFETNVRKVVSGETQYYLSPDDNYIYPFKGQGLWGMIEGLVSLNPDLKTVEKVVIISQEETPGLGARITEQEFLDQFEKKVISPKLLLTKKKSAGRNDTIEAITGATMTTQSLVDMINDCTENFRTNVVIR